MGKDYETTTKFKVDISELKSSMQEAKRQISVANSEFKAASSAMDDWASSSDGLSAKLKQLGSNLKSQKTILSSLEAQYEAVVAEQGEGSAAADRLKIAINNQKATINKTEREIKKYEAALEEVGNETKEASSESKTAAKAVDDLGDSAKDAEGGFTVLKGAIATFAGNALTSLVGGIKNAIGSLTGLADETREYRTEMGKLETAFSTAGHSTEEATKTYKDLYSVLGDEGQAVEAANHIAKLADNEKDLSTWTNIATGVYGTFGDSLPVEGLAEAANETQKTGQITGALADALNWAGVSEDEFQASLDKCNSEQERQELIMNTLNGLYGDAANAYRENNASVMEANKAQSNYQDTLANLGAKIEPVMTTVKQGITGLLQKFLELVEGVDMEAFTAKIQEGFAILTDTVIPAIKEGLQWIIDNKDIVIAALVGIGAGFAVFKVVGMITGVVNAVKSLGGAIGVLKAALAALGGPVTLVITIIGALVAAFIYLWNNCDGFREFWINLWEKIKTFCSNAIQAICNFFTVTVPNALNAMITFFAELPSKIWTWLLNTINKVGEWAKNMATKAKEAAKNFLNNVVNFIQELPYKVGYFLGSVIGNVAKWAVNMATKAKEAASNFLNNVVNFIKELPSKLWTWLVNAVNKVTTWSNNMRTKAKEAATNFINSAVNTIKELPSKIWTWLVNTANKIVEWGSNLKAKGKEAAKKLLDSVVDGVKELPSKMLSIGKDIVEGVWNGIKNAASTFKKNVKEFFSGIVDGVKDALGINSPSKLFADEVGKWIPEGIAVGIDKNAKSVLSSMKDMSSTAVAAAKNGLSKANGALNSVGVGSGRGNVVNNFNQVINSPKQLSRVDIYRQSKNLLGFVGGAG